MCRFGTVTYGRPIRAHQRSEQYTLGYEQQHQRGQSTFLDHLSEFDEDDSSLQPFPVSDDDDDEIEITGSRPIQPPTCLLKVNDFICEGPLRLDAGDDVELEDHSFLHITEVSSDAGDEPSITGYRFYRQNHYELLMPERHHELVQLVRIDKDLNSCYFQDIIPVAAVKRNCKIVFTNQQYRHLNYRRDVQGEEDVEMPLFFCRYTSADTHLGTEEGDPAGPPKSGRIEHFRYHQADSGSLVTRSGQQVNFRIPDSEVRQQWRGEAYYVLGGSHITHRHGMPKQQYTFGDAFAGAGGTSSGARTAGLKMDFAFDLDRCASETYTANFDDGRTRILETDVHDFVGNAVLSPNEWLVDILHLSPPCQPFCGANRKPNEEEDRINLLAFAKVADLLEICKPRIATLEEAKTLTNIDQREFFRRLIGYFLKKGYSIQWKAVDLWKFGVPQTRQRTIIIASGPGEKLPSFLKSTHGDEFGLKSLPTIGATLANIPDDAIHHDEIARMMSIQEPYDPDKLCPTILTRPKKLHVHPSGLRRFSTREVAAIQTFPHEFIFMGSAKERWKQIGNAVPPMFAAELFRHLKAELQAADQVELSNIQTQ